MNDIRPTIPLAQTVVAGAGVEDEGSAALECIRKCDHHRCGGVDDDEGYPTLDVPYDLPYELLRVSALNVLERVLLLQESAGRVVVVDTEPRPRDAFVLGRDIEGRERRRKVAPLADEEDRYLMMRLVCHRCLRGLTGQR